MHSGGPRQCVRLSTGGCVRPPVCCENMSRQAIVNFTGSGRGGRVGKKSLSNHSQLLLHRAYTQFMQKENGKLLRAPVSAPIQCDTEKGI